MLNRLRLQNFRCFSALALDFPEQGAILVGENAQGKTSILEAICVLVRLQSPRCTGFHTLTKFSSPGFGIAGNPWEQERKIKHTSSGLKLFSHEAPCSSRSSYLADGGLIVWMGNEDLHLIRGSGEARRTFLNFLGAQLDPTYRSAYTRYTRALKAKNLLLKDPKPRLQELIAYEDVLIEHGTYLIESRARMIEELSPLVSNAQIEISGKKETLSLSYLPASGPCMKESILQARQREIATRQAVVGPHRDDFSIRLHGMPAADYASEGQQRTIALALKIAQGDLLFQRREQTPIYLLDDIFGELDPARRNALLQHLPSPAQTFITTTYLGWRESSPNTRQLPVFQVTDGAVKRV